MKIKYVKNKKYIILRHNYHVDRYTQVEKKKKKINKNTNCVQLVTN